MGIRKTTALYVFVVRSEADPHADLYVGRTRDLTARLSNHRKWMREGSGRYRLLNEAYRKHGEDAFEVWILWKSDVALYSSLALRQHLRKREDFWIKELPATLNMRQRWDDPYFDVKRSTDFYMKRCEPVETFALFPPAYYAVRAPDGQEWVCRSMLEFCRWAEPICDVALNQSSMSRVARGEQKHHKGWTCGFINRAEYLSHFEDE